MEITMTMMVAVVFARSSHLLSVWTPHFNQGVIVRHFQRRVFSCFDSFDGFNG